MLVFFLFFSFPFPFFYFVLAHTTTKTILTTILIALFLSRHSDLLRLYNAGDDWISTRLWWDDLRRQFRNIPRRTCPSANSFTTNPTWTDVRSNPDLRGDRPTTKILSHIYLDCCHPGIYRNYHKTMIILDRVSMTWNVYWSVRPGGRACDCLLCLIVHCRHVPSAEHMLYAVRTRYS